jgi:hypothetical protein
MTSRETALRMIGMGDIFHDEDAAGPTRICLTLSVTDATILARAVTTQEVIEFDRRTGVAIHHSHSTLYRYVIDSVAPLPSDIHEIILSLDRKYREGECRRAEEPNWQPPSSESALTREQIRGLLFVADFYQANPLSA